MVSPTIPLVGRDRTQLMLTILPNGNLVYAKSPKNRHAAGYGYPPVPAMNHCLCEAEVAMRVGVTCAEIG